MLDNNLITGTENLQPFYDKKLKTLALCESYARLGLFKRSNRVYDCGSIITLKNCDNGHYFVKSANFCKDRLCPMCSWRMSRRMYVIIMKVIHKAIERQPMRFLFLTLTVKNVKADKLSETLDEMAEGYRLLMKYKAVTDHVVGWIRNLEVTYDKDRIITARRYNSNKPYYNSLGLKTGDPNPNYDTFHPHFHILVGVKPSYFGEGYIKQDKWSEMWKASAKLDYQPIVHIERVRPKKDNSDLVDAVAETAKYSVKSADYLLPCDRQTDKVVDCLASCLRNRRLVGFGKTFKTIRKELAKSDSTVDENKLTDDVAVDCTCPICQSTLVDVLMRWHFQSLQYVVTKCREADTCGES